MPNRTFISIAALALVLAACNPSDGAEGSTTSSTVEATTTSAPAETVLLSYSLESGTSFTYEVDIDQNIEMAASGDTTALGEEEIPGDLSLDVSGTTALTYDIEDGPEEGTFAITITGDLSGLDISGTMDGEQVSADDVPDFAGVEPVDVTIVVDEQGNIIPDDTGLGEGFLGDLGGLDMLSQLGGAGLGGGQFVGPPLSDDEVAVGDTWSETVETPALPGDDPITMQVDSEVVRADTVDGREVFVIETTTSTSGIEFDLADVLIGFMTALVPEDASDEELAEIDALVEQLRFAFSVDPQTAQMTTWFDFEDGLARQTDYSNATHLVMDINVPDEATGELVEFAMDMTITQDVTYRLMAGNA